MDFNNLNYYQLLEIPNNATQEEIKKAYRKQAKKYHPDVYDALDAVKIMQKINEAYEVLSDLEKRKEYDRLIGKTKNSQVYKSYTQTREESERDLDEWLKEYLRRRRNLDKLYHLYALIQSRIILLRSNRMQPNYQDVLKANLLLEAIKKELHSYVNNNLTNPSRILEELFNEMSKLFDKFVGMKDNSIEMYLDDIIISNLFWVEINLVLDKYTDKNKK